MDPMGPIMDPMGPIGRCVLGTDLGGKGRTFPSFKLFRARHVAFCGVSRPHFFGGKFP